MSRTGAVWLGAYACMPGLLEADMGRGILRFVENDMF